MGIGSTTGRPGENMSPLFEIHMCIIPAQRLGYNEINPPFRGGMDNFPFSGITGYQEK